jgi:hypothetical protein
MIRVFTPHVLGIMGAILWIKVVIELSRQRSLLDASISAIIYIVIFLILVGTTPSRWLRAAPTQDQNAEVAVVFNFGYELSQDQMTPGEGNQHLWEWIIHNRPSQLTTILVQEGVWVAANEETLKNLDLEMVRIHRHDPLIYVDTLNAAFCSIQQIQRLGKKRIMLIAHDLQIQRVAWDFQRVAQVNCPDCVFLIPEIGDVPYPANSVHLQTRSEFIYKITELLISRPRDFLSQVPTRCIAPIDSN